MNIRTSAFRGLAVLTLTVLGMAACEDKIELPPDEPDPIEVTVAPTQVEIPVGGTASAAAVVKNSTNQAVTWSSQATGVASVNANGQITGVAPGSTVIVATAAADANAKGFVSVTVVAPTITLTVLPSEQTIQVGQTTTLAATVSGSTNTAVTWTTSAAAVATVNAQGVVTAVAPGTAVITATSAANTTVKDAAVITVVPVTSTVQISLQPTEATTTIGGTVQLVPQVTGTTNTAVTYRSSAEGVATVSAAGLVTGVSGGTAVITAIAAADTLKKATSVITVSGAPPEPSISIASIVENESQQPIDPDDVEGQVDVTVNVSAVPENDVRAVVLYITGEGLDEDVEVCRQNFATPLGTTQGVATINCPVNTAAYDDETFLPLFVNGEYTFEARALNSENEITAEAQFCPGGDCVVVFDNSDFAIVDVVFENDDEDGDGAADATQALDQDGERWNGGDVIANVHPIFYSGITAASFNATLECDEFDDTVELEEEDGTWTYRWTEEDDLPDMYTDCAVFVGEGLDDTGLGFEVENESDEFQLDNQAPDAATASLPTPRYINDAFTITVTTDDNGGVDRQNVNTVVQILNDAGTVVKEGPAGTLTINATGLAESATSDAAGSYQVQVVVEDALGNTDVIEVGSTFGVDRTVPTLTVDESEESGSTVDGVDVTIPLTFDFEYIDAATPPAGPSGFSADPVRVEVRLYNATYPSGRCLDVAVVAGVGTAGAPLSSTAACTRNVSTQLIIPGTYEGYYVVTAWTVDAAGNATAQQSFTYLYDITNPEVGNLTVPSTVTGGQAFSLAAQVVDNVELGEVWSSVIYTGPAAPDTTYAIVLQENTIGTYGVPLVSTELSQLHTVTAPYFIRSITELDAAGHPVVGYANTFTPQFAEYAVLDVAGVELGSDCPAVGVAVADSTQNCFIRRQDITAAYQVGNLAVNDSTTKWWAYSGFSFAGTGDQITKFVMDTGTDALDAIATGPFQTFNNPFPGGVYFYAVDESGRAHLIGQASVSVTDNTITGVRTWRYTVTQNFDEDSTTRVFALALNGTTGDALVTPPEYFLVDEED